MIVTHSIPSEASRRARRAGTRLALAATLCVALPAAAQEPASVGHEVFSGSEAEQYLRTLQTLGKVPQYPLSIRGLSAAEVGRIAPADSGHVWSARLRFRPDSARGVRWVRPEVRSFFNSAYPFGRDDGAVWAGRGGTVSVRGGVALRAGAVSLVLAPEAFIAQNTEFELMDNGKDGKLAFADPLFPTAIDAPQRFGDGAYTRIDPGQSTLRLDARGVVAGISTANQVWGPADQYPYILGNAGPGFLHGFVGTSRPADVWVGRFHGRLVYGKLDQSDYSSVEGIAERRFMSGLVGVLQPRGLPGLEVGAARFFHTPWPEDGLTPGRFAKPFEGFLKFGLDESGSGGDLLSDDDNQLASIFMRWVAPRSGFEVYAEYGRDDHNNDQRDLILEPDHDSGYMLGLRKAWTPDASRMRVLRAEVMNTRVTHLLRVRPQVPAYIHAGARQGHTQAGQFLGSRAGFGGGGAMVAFDAYHPRGRWTVAWSREQRRERGEFDETRVEMLDGIHVAHSLGAEALVAVGRFDVTAGLAGVYEFNRYFADDATNLNATLSFRWAR